MKKSFLGSVSMHALIIVIALFGIQSAKPFEVKPVDAIQVDISNITDKTNVKAQSRSVEKPAEKPKPKVTESKESTKPQEKVAEEKKTARVEPEKKVEPEKPKEPEKKVEPPKPKEPEKKVEDKPVDPDPLKEMLEAEEAQIKKAEEEKKKEEDKKKKEEAKKKKAEEEKKKKAAEDKKKAAQAESDRKKLMEKLEKDLLADTSVTESQSTLKKEDEAGSPEKAEKDFQGKDEAMSATIIDALRSRFNDCWSIPPSVRESRETVDVRWQLSRDGQVQGQPVVVGGNGGGVARQAAVSAVLDCAPYDWLPADGYNLWKEIEWTFAPR
jgi:TolA protein